MKVSAFSTWEKEVSKLMDDPRFNGNDHYFYHNNKIK